MNVRGIRSPAGRRSPLAALAVAALVALAITAGCASPQKQVYVDWIAINNPAVVCGGKPDCVQHSRYRGKALCTIVTADAKVSYARLGEQVRQCVE